MTLSRRAFLKSSAALAAVAGCAPGLAASGGASADPMDRIALTTVTFRFRFAQTRPADYAGTDPLMTLPEFPAYVRDRFGVRNVELWSQHVDSTEAGHLAEIRRAVERAGSRVVNLQMDQPYNLASSDEDERQASVDLVSEWVDVARAVGSPSIRANAGTGTIETAVRSLRQVADYADRQGVRLLTENHGGISTDLGVLLQILDALDGDARAVADFGNFPDGTDRFDALARLIPYTDLISAKTLLFDDGGEHMSFDFDRCVRTAEAAGFQGIYSGEQWDPSTDPLDAEAIAEWMVAHLRTSLLAARG
ncbi:sugar phosphate isomerase/epimerase family protein [Rubrivirga marina]|uniref:Xylose isomerase-like TIM barrel domain-containing protein n=1 Tax=Rubrivirga marina TaxID=1196024 RepID=A0A271IV05_9BACT|nr:sugar phosphate isomerase/epimerase family protein [Rubrivirga marina]PAP75043.1 hypothetical protein BSZ37_00545 [Rubrivirga marina]